MAVLTINQYIDAINAFVDNVVNSQNSYYLFYGKTDSWVNPAGVADDTTVPTADASVYSYEQSIYNDLIFGKLITEYDIIKMAPRYDWVSGTIYDSYDQNDGKLYDKKFFVVTDSYEVYKCIFNNNVNGVGKPSTVKPSVLSTQGFFTTGDGYVWKYMFTIAPNARAKFLSTNYIPVTPDETVANNAIPGSIDHISIITSGNNYHAHHEGTLQNFTNTTVVQISNNASTVTGAYTGSAIYLSSGGGSGQLRQIYNYRAAEKLVTVTEPFETFVQLQITNPKSYGNEINPGAITKGLLASQRFEIIEFLYQTGYFNSLDTIIQSDTEATAQILTANANQMRVSKTDELANDFFQFLPYYDTASDHTQKSGTVNITGNTVSLCTVTFGGSGYTANSAVVTRPNPLDGTVYNISPTIYGVDSVSDTIYLTDEKSDPVNAKTVFSLNDKLYYQVPTNNTAITGLTPNSYYYVSYTSGNETRSVTANATGIDALGNYIKITSADSYFRKNDYVYYTVPLGGVKITGLEANSYYYVSCTSSTYICLSLAPNSSNLDIATGGSGIHSIRNTGNRIAISATPGGANSTITSSDSNEIHVIRGGGGGRNAVINAESSAVGVKTKGRINALHVENWGGGYSLPPVLEIANPPSLPFNAYADIDDAVNFIKLGTNSVYFSTNDVITYTVAGGNSHIIPSEKTMFNGNSSVTTGDVYIYSDESNKFKAGDGVIFIANSLSIPSPLVNGYIYTIKTANTLAFSLSNSTSATITLTKALGTSTTAANASIQNVNTTYYAVQANSSGFKLSKTPLVTLVNGTTTGGTPIALTKPASSESGHFITGQRATGTASIDTVYVNSHSGTSFNTTNFPIGSYVCIGDNPSKNIRRVIAVNTSVITVHYPFYNDAVANVIFTVNSAATPTSIRRNIANGTIENVNLKSITLQIANLQLPSINYIQGEKVEMVSVDNRTQGANGIVAIANTTVILLSDVKGEFAAGEDRFLRGTSSLQKSQIVAAASLPTISLKNPEGTFVSGQKITVKTQPELVYIADATIVTSVRIPNEMTNYEIAPYVEIIGDGTGARARALVNSVAGSANNIDRIEMISYGNNYTYANIKILVNPSLPTYGNGATANPIISPVSGHGSDPYRELGARYAGVSVNIDSGINEQYKFPIHSSFRKVGIIQNPLFEEVTIHLDSFDKIDLTIENKEGSGFSTGEYCYQNSSKAAGVVVSANTTLVRLKNVVGTFDINSGTNGILGLSSETTASVVQANTVYFEKYSNVEIVSETKSNANASVAEIFTQERDRIKLSNVSGKFDANDTLYEASSGATANVTAIYTASGSIDITTNFGRKFNQTARISLTELSSPFTVGELITQDITEASGILYDNTSELDIKVTVTAGTFFSVGNRVVQQASINDPIIASGTVTFVWNNPINTNIFYLQLSNVIGNFAVGATINNKLGVTNATITSIQPVILLRNVKGKKSEDGVSTKFDYGKNNKLVGSISKAYGVNRNDDTFYKTIIYPDLVRNSGKVVYIENVSPIERSADSVEKINLIIKF